MAASATKRNLSTVKKKRPRRIPPTLDAMSLRSARLLLCLWGFLVAAPGARTILACIRTQYTGGAYMFPQYYPALYSRGGSEWGSSIVGGHKIYAITSQPQADASRICCSVMGAAGTSSQDECMELSSGGERGLTLLEHSLSTLAVGAGYERNIE
ncbi:hypothetical protein WOLCODRAFT_152032 [Wolfiporia cocos MD-104 SS10]|uniref:Uncharacterized protein n=1 Tax=Wolfiporia cocos (strain MD-104) TaxID=742152 RepID=A0A2H3JJF4_WOLCO|nr:hypothetical protein WOLCODRAFT_152032 [Wolfiporia cocos MD-104 SS10]